MDSLRFSLKLKNRLEDLEKLNQALTLLSARLGMSKKHTCETSLVLEELFSNIIRHGCCDGKKHNVHITIALEEDMFTMRIEDDGIPFNPIAVAVPDVNSPPEDRLVGGLGIHLVKSYTEEIVYQRRGKKNVLTLRKKITPISNEERGDGDH